jgi:rod shape-determining protein MreD
MDDRGIAEANRGIRRPGIRPRPSLWRRLDMSARHAFPAASTALLLLLLAAPLGLDAQAALQGAVALGCVFFWSLYRPASMSPPVVFALGVLADLLSYSPLGVSVLTLLLLHGVAQRARRALARQGFVLIWLVFSALALAACLLEWLLTAILDFRLLPPGPALFMGVLAAGLYPVLAVPLISAHHTLAEPDHA